MTPYNKEEVMKEFEKLESFDSFFAGLSQKDERSSGRLYQDYLNNFLSAALDSAYKAGEEARTEKVRDVMKKAYQNHKENHLCRFNDGEQNCNCYLSGMNEIIVALEELK